eukprot:g24501.t1
MDKYMNKKCLEGYGTSTSRWNWSSLGLWSAWTDRTKGPRSAIWLEVQYKARTLNEYFEFVFAEEEESDKIVVEAEIVKTMGWAEVKKEEMLGRE